MALNRTSKFTVDDLFNTENNDIKKTDISNEAVSDDHSEKIPSNTEIHTFKKEKSIDKPAKKIIGTKSRTYTIDDYTYYLLKATVKVLRDNDVRNEENDSLITESAFIRKAIRTELERVNSLNGASFLEKVRRVMESDSIDGSIKY